MPDSRVLIVGATSGIARALARLYAADGAHLALAGRALPEVERLASDLRVRHEVAVAVRNFVADDFSSHAAFVEDVDRELSGIDVAVVAIGDLGDQELAQSDFEHARRIIDTNFTGTVSLVTELAKLFEARHSGTIVCLGSVAGDRGRPSNYVYGSAKAGLDQFLEGLRARLFKAGVNVLTVKPGFVDTRMTFSRAVPLAASPERVARSIKRAVDRRRNVVYTPWFWRPIMFAVRSVPQPVFKRLNL